jgi:hypothetical protein
MRRVAAKSLIILAGLCAVAYSLDWLQFKLRGSAALGSVQTRIAYAVAQKNGKTEYLIQPPQIETCAQSLLSHAGFTPCWYLRRDPERQIRI